MKKKTIFLFFLLSAIKLPVEAQQPPSLHTISWEMLKDVTWSKKYMEALSDFFPMPNFGKQIELLDNKPVTIQGFYVPVDMEGTIFALSESPSYTCFFCGVGGIESVMEILVKEGHRDLKRIRTDRYIQVKGIFSINRDNPEHLMYILKDAELVKVVR